jgi:hypothetical protein
MGGPGSRFGATTRLAARSGILHLGRKGADSEQESTCGSPRRVAAVGSNDPSHFFRGDHCFSGLQQVASRSPRLAP